MMSIERRFAWPKLRFALLPILGVLAAAPAAADYYEGLTAYEGQDYALALSELEPLARTGDARAQLLLGRMYTAGQGTLQDFVRAHMWFNLAASAGAPEAAAAREAIAQRMTPDQIAEAQRLAAAWRPQPAAHLGEAAFGGTGVGVASGAPPPAPAPPYDEMARAYVVGIQQELLARGYDPGPADGVLGWRTRAAIRRFQADAGLPVDGEVSHALLNHLKFVTAPATF